MLAKQYRGTVYKDRRIAAAQGETLFLGGECKNGHEGALRYVSTGQCTECMKERNRDFAATLRASRRPAVSQGSRLFAYHLHPEDHTAALAFCQALDLQRGRMPRQNAANVDATAANNARQFADTSKPLVLPASIAEARKLLSPDVLAQHEAARK